MLGYGHSGSKQNSDNLKQLRDEKDWFSFKFQFEEKRSSIDVFCGPGLLHSFPLVLVELCCIPITTCRPITTHLIGAYFWTLSHPPILKCFTLLPSTIPDLTGALLLCPNHTPACCSSCLRKAANLSLVVAVI